MKPPITESICSESSLLEFLEGELTAEQEQSIAAHIDSCSVCQVDLKEHRKLLTELDDSFVELPEIPADFSKIVSASAKSQVSAVRRPYELRTAVLVCIGLLMTALLAISVGPLNSVVGPTIVFEKILSVVTLVFSLISDIVLGLGIIGRAISIGIGISPLIILGGLIGSILFLAVRRNQRTARMSGVGRSNR